MAWIELHQSVWTHRKTLILAAALDISPIYAASHMIHLWTWALDNAPSGFLDGLPNRVIVAGAGWTGDADQFVEAALQAGYLERENLALHDWQDYAGRLMDQRKLHAERTQRKRQLYDDTQLTRYVRFRDGDLCRYCGKVVNWSDRKSRAGGTYDHVDPEGPNVAENIVVACRGCNSKKGRRLPGMAGMHLICLGELDGGDQSDIYQKSTRDLPDIKSKSAIPNRTVPNQTNESNDEEERTREVEPTEPEQPRSEIQQVWDAAICVATRMEGPEAPAAMSRCKILAVDGLTITMAPPPGEGDRQIIKRLLPKINVALRMDHKKPYTAIWREPEPIPDGGEPRAP